MSKQLYTAFLLSNVKEVAIPYRILRVIEPVPDDGRRPVRLQQWADELWRKRLKCPVFPRVRNGRAEFLVASDVVLDGIDLSFIDVPGGTYHIEPLPGLQVINAVAPDSVERRFGAKVLERALTDHLLSHYGETLWKDAWTRFFNISPENAGNRSDTVNAYRGFRFSVVPLGDSDFAVTMDVITRYVGRESLAEVKAREGWDELVAYHTAHFDRRRTLLRDNGKTKYPCYFAGMTGVPISEFPVEAKGMTVFEYYRKTYPDIRVLPSDETAQVVVTKDQARSQQALPIPASRLFPVYTTDDPGLRRCSAKPTLAPSRRVEILAGFRRCLNGSRLGEVELKWDQHMLSERPRYFPIPSLEFGAGSVLAADPGQKYGVGWVRRKREALYHHGPFHKEPLPPMVVLFPSDLPRVDRTDLIDSLTGELSSLGIGTSGVMQIPYEPDEHGRDLRAKAAGQVLLGRFVFLLCILSSAFQSAVHGEFKQASAGLPSQCIQQDTIRRLRKSHSTVQNLALGVITASGAKPWVLARGLHHDLHIGIDVLQGRVAYNYLYGLGGRSVRQSTGVTRGEIIRGRGLREELIHSLRDICSEAVVSSAVIHRDGRSWPEEIEAITQAFRSLQSTNHISDHFRWAVADIRKSHIPVRILQEDGGGKFTNPFPGCYMELSPTQGIINTTGRPQDWDGQGRTAGTLYVELAHNPGGFTITETLQDVFALTQLNWSAPDIDIALPVTIRWADDALRREYTGGEDDSPMGQL